MVTARKRREAREERKLSSARKTAEQRQKSFGSGAYKIPDGVGLIQIKDQGKRVFEFIPYLVKNNPKSDEGEWTYERTFYTHRFIGPKNKDYICLANELEEACPVCEYMRSLDRNDPDEEALAKKLAPKERQLFQVIDVKERDKGIQLWEYAPFLFGEVLEDKITFSEDGEYDEFFDPEKGLTVQIAFKKNSGGGYSFFKAADIEFRDRKKPIGWGFVDENSVCLDELLTPLSYDELKDIFLKGGTPESEDDGDDEDDAPKTKGKSKVKKSKTKPVDDDDDFEDDDELEDEDEDLDWEDDEDEEEDDEEEEPPKKSKKSKVKSKSKSKKPEPEEEEDDEDEDFEDDEEDDEDDEDWDDEEEEEPPKKSKAKSSSKSKGKSKRR